MGKSANMFLSSSEGKETLNKRVTLLTEQMNYARSRKNHLLDYLKNELSNKLGVKVGYCLQGSYKNHTLIRPVRIGEEFDIDAGVYLMFDAESHGVQANDAKSIFRSVLVHYCAANNDAKLADSKPNCERVCFPGNFHIDLPLYYYVKETETCRLATEKSGWIDSDPKSLQDWFDKKISTFPAEKKARLRRCIKNIKTWVALRAVKLPSIAITVFIANTFADFEQDDDVFVQNAANLLHYLKANNKILSPINGDDLIGGTDEDKAKLSEQLILLLDSLIRANSSKSAMEAHPSWSTIFEHIYPPFAEVEELAHVTNLPALTTVPSINIRKKDRDNRFLEDSSGDIIHGYLGEHLDFSIANTNSYPTNSSVKWMVRNKEKEASIANDLGHFRTFKLSDVCEEHCGYRGTHYMECVIEANGQILGAKSIKVIVSSIERPLRNPPRQSYGPKR
ncbi:cyclic GMP-AMP synthase DncV-like nucleotidyltransferase [Shewanella baltica]|uniref:cyclic GMP-AMP synthase DncV-like nucleotidyltransferase n=1 Tax=Shewanella baltica TaxID=62322 RepID=UPI003D79381F